MAFIDEYPQLTEDFLAITQRLSKMSPEVAERIDIAVDMWHAYESPLAIETVLDLIADPEGAEIQLLFSDFSRLMYISGCIGSTRHVWVDFAPPGCLVTRD